MIGDIFNVTKENGDLPVSDVKMFASSSRHPQPNEVTGGPYNT